MTLPENFISSSASVLFNGLASSQMTTLPVPTEQMKPFL